MAKTEHEQLVEDRKRRTLETLADALDRERRTLIEQCDRLKSVADVLRESPDGNYPMHQIRMHLAPLGFALIHVNALRTLEACAQEPEDDGLSYYAPRAASPFETARRAALEAISFCEERFRG